MGMPVSGNAGGLQSVSNLLLHLCHCKSDNDFAQATEFGTLPSGPKPLVTGWTSNAIGTVVACIISALIGLASICWYGFSSTGDGADDEEEEEKEPEKSATSTATNAL